MSEDSEPTKEVVKIFIGSSKLAENDAQALSTKLGKNRGRYSLKTTPWWQLNSPLLDILDEIINETRNSDFAIILLSSHAQGREKTILNYNCLYEAGLFTGALGVDKNRVFLVTDRWKCRVILLDYFAINFAVAMTTTSRQSLILSESVFVNTNETKFILFEG